MSDEQKKWFEALKTITNISVLVNTLNLTKEETAQFWKKFLSLLRAQDTPIDWESGYVNSLFGIVTSGIDLPDGDNISQLYEEIRQAIETTDSYWNESLQELVEFFINNIENNDDKTFIPLGEHSITTDTLRNADAGNNLPEDRLENEQWIVPWWNVDDESYADVRGKDIIQEVLVRYQKMQYTHTPSAALSKWIRLLMPQYGRRVEVEDLNRNFWVITQTIAAISAYLFDKNNPISKTLEGLLREVSEIWENILMLWTEVAVMSQSGSEEIQTIVMPLQPYGYRQYDGFDEVDNDWYTYEVGENSITVSMGEKFHEKTINAISYLTKQYSNMDLCVIPYVRLNNYKHNFYAGEWYPCVYVYSYATKTWDIYPIEEQILLEENSISKLLIISPIYEERVADSPRYSMRMFASKINNGKLLYSYPFGELSKTATNISRILMYGALRTESSVSCERINGKVKLTSLSLKVTDASAMNIYGKERLLGTYNMVLENGGETLQLRYEENELPPVDITPNKLYSKQLEVDKPGYYMGELPTWRGKTLSESKSENLFNSVSHVIKVGSYLPSTSTAFYTSMMSDGYHTLMRGNVTAAANASLQLSFFLNDWTTYDYSKDLVGQAGNDLCFTAPPIKKSCTEVNQQFLEYEGLKAVKNYLIKTDNLSSPCYVATTIGLTPWNNANIFYWDVGALCHIYHFIPSEISLKDKPTDNSYNDVYNQFPVFNSSQDGVIESGELLDEEGQVLGKIISCNLIKKYDGFFHRFDMSTTSVYVEPAWRQFQIKSNDDEKCICIKYNENEPEDKVITYEVSFSTTFKGEVNYFDNRWAQTNQIETFDAGAQVGYAPGIIITETGYEQNEDGIIAAATQAGVIIKDRENKATNTKSTGFINPVGSIDFMNIPANTTEQQLYSSATQGTRIYT